MTRVATNYLIFTDIAVKSLLFENRNNRLNFAILYTHVTSSVPVQFDIELFC